MRILFVHNFFQQFGGEDAVALTEKQLLESHGEALVCYTRHNDEIKAYGLTDKIRFPLQTIFSQHTRTAMTEVVKNFGPEVAYIHNVFPLISPSLYHVLHSLGVPLVQVIHDFRFLCPNGWFYTRGQICKRCKYGNYLHAVRYRCYRNSSFLSAVYAAAIGINRLASVMSKIAAYVCLTEFSQRELLEVGIPEEKIFIRPNFIDAATTTPTPGKGNYIVYLGRLSHEKGVWTLIHAFERLKDVALRIVGTGPLEERLRSYVQEKNLQHISLVGFKQGQEKKELLENSFCTIVPSEWYENFPVVILESYAAAKPVIGANVGSLPHIIEDGKSGLLFEPGNPLDLAEKVQFLLARPEERKRMGQYGRKLVETQYSPERSYQTLMAIFKEVRSKQ